MAIAREKSRSIAGMEGVDFSGAEGALPYPSLVLSNVGAFILMYVHMQMNSTTTMASDCSSKRAELIVLPLPHPV